MNLPPLIAVYADESCLGNGRDGDNPGGAGVLIEFRRLPDEEPVRRDLWVSETATTNNRMALRSVIEAMKAVSRKGQRFRIDFTTDSRYIVDGMTRWVHDWARRGWTRRSGPIENLDLWREAVSEAARHQVRWNWVRGHHGHAQNEYVNHLAVQAAGTLGDSGGLVESGFPVWLAGYARPLKVQEFPDELAFRPSAALPAGRTVSP